MGRAFWIRRFASVFVLAFAIIAAAQLLRGRALAYSVQEALLWALISATIFTVARYFQARRGQHCALCRDTPEMQADDREPRG